jgi:hypothetical protein
MKSFIVSTPPTIILTFVLFTGVIGMETAYGQSSAPFANCIQMIIKDSFVQLVTDDDCNEQQFTEATAYYKANGYPIESTFMDMGETKLIQLDTQEFNDATK